MKTMKRLLIILCLAVLPIVALCEPAKIEEVIVNSAMLSNSNGKIYASIEENGNKKNIYELDTSEKLTLKPLASDFDFEDYMIVIGDCIYKSRREYTENEFVLAKQGEMDFGNPLKLIEKDKVDGKTNLLAHLGNSFCENELVFMACDVDENYYLFHYDFDKKELKVFKKDDVLIESFQILEKNKTLLIHDKKTASIYSWEDNSMKKLAKLPETASGIAYHKEKECFYYSDFSNNKFFKQSLDGKTEEIFEFDEPSATLYGHIVGNKYVALYFGKDSKIISIDLGK